MSYIYGSMCIGWYIFMSMYIGWCLYMSMYIGWYIHVYVYCMIRMYVYMYTNLCLWVLDNTYISMCVEWYLHVHVYWVIHICIWWYAYMSMCIGIWEPLLIFTKMSWYVISDSIFIIYVSGITFPFVGEVEGRELQPFFDSSMKGTSLYKTYANHSTRVYMGTRMSFF